MNSKENLPLPKYRTPEETEKIIQRVRAPKEIYTRQDPETGPDTDPRKIADLRNSETGETIILEESLENIEQSYREEHAGENRGMHHASQLRRFKKLTNPALAIATEGIMRHLKACKKIGVDPTIDAIREIIDDALNGRRSSDF